MRLAEAWHAPRQPADRGRDVGLHAQWRSGPRAPQQLRALYERLERSTDVGVEDLALAGRHDLAAFARKEVDAEIRFEQLQLVADRRVGHAQLLRRLADALAPGCGFEAFEGIERR